MSCNHGNTKQEAAQWALSSYRLIPLLYRDKRPHTELIMRATGEPGWGSLIKVHDYTADAIDLWFSYPAVNLGVLLLDGLCVLDFDDLESWHDWPGHGRLPEVKTARGVHVYFRNDHLTGTKKVLRDGRVVGDLKANGYVVAPPSVHESGHRYSWLTLSQDDIPYIVNMRHFLDGLTLSEAASPSIMGAGIALSDYDINHPMAPADMTPIQTLTTITGQRGDFAHGLCPLHDDDSPSFWVHIPSNTCGCFTCGFRGMTVKQLKALIRARSKQSDAVHSLFPG